MALLKRNPIFTLICVISLLSAGGVGYLAFAEYTQLTRTEKASLQQRRILDDILAQQPSLTAANVEAAAANVQQLDQTYQRLAENLYGEAVIVGSTNGVQVMASIQEYISEFTYRAKNHVNADGKPAPVTIAKDLSFGFEAYAEQATVPDVPEVIPLLDQQRQVLSYVMRQLLASDPFEVMSVQRQIFPGESPMDPKKLNGFNIPQVASARVDGLIETIPVKVQFQGYTSSLRKFINKLAEFEMPILVRSIQVSCKDQVMEESKAKSKSTSLEELFGSFGESSTSEKPSAVKAEQKPIISENASKFTLILEYIKIAPSEQIANLDR
jgi:hypothetical protein